MREKTIRAAYIQPQTYPSSGENLHGKQIHATIENNFHRDDGLADFHCLFNNTEKMTALIDFLQLGSNLFM